MDENTSEVVQDSTVETDVTPESDLGTSEVVDPWEQLEKDLGVIEDPDDELKGQSEADPPKTDEKAEPKTGEPAKDATPEKSNQTFTLKHLGNEMVVSQDEAIAYAQKGLDYDRIRPLYDEAKDFKLKYSGIAAALDEYAAAENVAFDQIANNIIDNLDNKKAQEIAERDGIDFKTALREVKLDRREKADAAAKDAAAKKAAAAEVAEQAKQDRISKETAEFIKKYPNVPLDKDHPLPPEVLAEIDSGITLLNAYRSWELAKRESDLAAKEKNLENKTKSTGSKHSAGAQKDRDPFRDDWYKS